MNLKKIGKVFTSKFVGTWPSSYKKRIYRAAVSQRLRKTELWGSSITLTATMKYLGVQLYLKFHFHVLVDFIISQSVRIMGLILTINYPSPKFNGLLIFYLSLS